MSFEWDSHSDQPKIIFDKDFKRRMRARYWSDYLKMAVTSAAVMPAAIAYSAFTKARTRQKSACDLIGIGVNLDKGSEQFDLVDELGVQHVLIRVPLWDVANLQAYRAFAQEFRRRGKTVLVNVLQDRVHIESRELLSNDLGKIFENFQGISSEYQIGNAINRVKWGFFAVKEYLEFFQTAQNLRDKRFKALELIGPAVIDFEYHFAVRALFNNYNIQFDRLSALLYVDRMGAPDNRQCLFFGAQEKMSLLATLGSLSTKVRNKGIYITEVNWPLTGTAPFAPTSEKECVTEQQYVQYMQRYFELGSQTRGIERIYWHQLIAPGYGLIDNRRGVARKTLAFNALRLLLA